MDGAPRFLIESAEAESMAKSMGHTSVLQFLPTLVKPTQNLARPPISDFPVAAVGLSSDGRIFLGVNLEFPGLPLHHSVHAEQFLLTNISLHHSPSLLFLAVSAAPCGHCRQFFQELRHVSTLKFHVTSPQNPPTKSSPMFQKHDHEDFVFKPFLSILPNPFGPHDLLDKHTPLLLEKHENGLSLVPEKTEPNCGNLCNGVCEFFAKNELELKIQALEAANNSHAPYSGCPSGVCLMDCDGKVYKGCYMESAAYNPSMGPVQAALVAYVAGGGGGYERIVAGVLVENEGAKVRQEETAKMLLKVVSPPCEFRVFHCRSAEAVKRIHL